MSFAWLILPHLWPSAFVTLPCSSPVQSIQISEVCETVMLGMQKCSTCVSTIASTLRLWKRERHVNWCYTRQLVLHLSCAAPRHGKQL